MSYALHEVLEIHEIVAFKTLCLTKAKTMQMLVSDTELKAIMQMDSELATRQLQDLGHILKQAKEQNITYEPHH